MRIRTLAYVALIIATVRSVPVSAEEAASAVEPVRSAEIECLGLVLKVSFRAPSAGTPGEPSVAAQHVENLKKWDDQAASLEQKEDYAAAREVHVKLLGGCRALYGKKSVNAELVERQLRRCDWLASLDASQRRAVKQAEEDLAAAAEAKEGPYEEAEAKARQAAAEINRIAGRGHWMMGHAQHVLAKIASQRGDHERAEELYREAIASARANVIVGWGTYISLVVEYANMLRDDGRLVEAHEQYVQAAWCLEGSDGPVIRLLLLNLSKASLKAGHHDEAARAAEQAATLRQLEFGGSSQAYRQALEPIASCYQAAGKFERAAAVCNRLIEIDRTVLATDPKAHGTALIELGQRSQVLGDYASAECFFLEARRISEGEVSGVFRAICDAQLGSLYLDMERYALASLHLQEALSSFEENAKDTDHYCGTLLSLARLETRMKNYTRAEQWIEQASQISAPNMKGRKALTKGCLLLAQQNSAGAESLLKEAVDASRWRRPRDETFTAEACIALAEAQFGQQKYADAQSHALVAWRTWSGFLADEHPKLHAITKLIDEIAQKSGQKVDYTAERTGAQKSSTIR